MAGPIQTYLTTQLASQTAFTGPFGLLTLVVSALATATNAGEFNATVDCSLFAAPDVARLSVYLDSLGYHVDFVGAEAYKTLNITWGEGLVIGGSIPVTGSVAVTNLPAVQNVSVLPVADFDYVAGSLTAPGSVIGFGNCGGIRVFANGVDSKFAISGGTPITLRSNQTFYHKPQGELMNPTIDWFAGSIDVWMEVEGALPPSIPDLGMSLGIAHL